MFLIAELYLLSVLKLMLVLDVSINLLFLLNVREPFMDNVARFVELIMVSCLYVSRQYL
jgi:hypothetical protein